MTKRKERTVPDDILGKVCRKIIDLSRRILEGGVDPDRAAFFVAGAQEVPSSIRGCPISMHGYYLLECRWSWDSGHAAFATIDLEREGFPYGGFHALLDRGTPKEAKDQLMKLLRRVRDSQCGGPDPKMVRLYAMLGERYLGIDPSVDFSKHVSRPIVDVHFVLEPIIWFDKDENPRSSA